MRKTLKRAIYAFLFFSSGAIFQAAAEPALTVKCGEPKGTRFDLMGGKIETDTDAFTGVNPLFIFDNDKPGVVTVFWGHTEKYGTPPLTSAKEASIISKTAKQITAVRVAANNLVELYSLFPQEEVLYYTEHYHGFPIFAPGSKSFYAKCSFVPSP